MRKILLSVVAFVMLFACVSYAEGLEGSIYAAGVSKYLWRGQLLNHNACIQPGMSISFEGISAILWASADSDVNNEAVDEFDYYLTYEHKIPWVEILSLRAGLASYYVGPYGYPFIVSEDDEISLTLTGDVISNPYISWSHSIKPGTYNYMEMGLSHEMEFGEMAGGSVAAGAAFTAGLNFNEPTRFDEDTHEPLEEGARFTVASLNIYGNYSIGDYTLTPALFGQLKLSDNYKNDVMFSLTLNYDWAVGGEEKEDTGAGEKTE